MKWTNDADMLIYIRLPCITELNNIAPMMRR